MPCGTERSGKMGGAATNPYFAVRIRPDELDLRGDLRNISKYREIAELNARHSTLTPEGTG
jgi:hypothetical protein